MPNNYVSPYKTALPGMSGYTPPESLPDTYLEPNYADTYNKWKTKPSPETTGGMLKMVDPIINEALRSYGSGASTSPTLRGKAKRLTVSALGSYDPSRAKLRTHLLSQLQGLRRMAAKEEQIINIPEQVMLDAGGLRESENRLRDELGREPSDLELADHTGLSTKRIGYIRTMKPSFAEGRLTTVDEEGTGMSMPAVKHGPDSGALKAWHDYVYHASDPVDQKILEHTLGLHRRPVLSNQEIAKMLRLSPGAVSQRKAKIQEKLDLLDVTGIM